MTNSVYIIPEANVLGKLPEFDRSRNSFYNNAKSDFDVMGMKSKHQNTYFKTTNEHVVSEKKHLFQNNEQALCCEKDVYFIAIDTSFFLAKMPVSKYFITNPCFGRIIFSLLVSMLQANTFPRQKCLFKSNEQTFLSAQKILVYMATIEHVFCC